jgi:hypothetical protein
MEYAAWTMARTRGIRITSRVYAVLKERATARLRIQLQGVPLGPMPQSQKDKIRAAALRRYSDPEEKKLSSIRSTGRTHSSDSKEKMRQAKIGYQPAPTYGMEGKTHSAETREKMRLAWERRRGTK